jgi:hypothetical protein
MFGFAELWGRARGSWVRPRDPVEALKTIEAERGALKVISRSTARLALHGRPAAGRYRNLLIVLPIVESADPFSSYARRQDQLPLFLFGFSSRLSR